MTTIVVTAGVHYDHVFRSDPTVEPPHDEVISTIFLLFLCAYRVRNDAVGGRNLLERNRFTRSSYAAREVVGDIGFRAGAHLATSAPPG
jgi:hypothetical protein